MSKFQCGLALIFSCFAYLALGSRKHIEKYVESAQKQPAAFAEKASEARKVKEHVSAQEISEKGKAEEFQRTASDVVLEMLSAELPEEDLHSAKWLKDLDWNELANAVENPSPELKEAMKEVRRAMKTAQPSLLEVSRSSGKESGETPTRQFLAALMVMASPGLAFNLGSGATGTGATMRLRHQPPGRATLPSMAASSHRQQALGSLSAAADRKGKSRSWQGIALSAAADRSDAGAHAPGIQDLFDDSDGLPDMPSIDGDLTQDLFDDLDVLPDAMPISGNPTHQRRSNSTLVERRQLLSSALAAWALLSAAKPAYAALGSARAGVTSFPGAPSRITAEDFAGLDLPTQLRVESVLGSKELKGFVEALATETLKLDAKLETMNQEDTRQAAKVSDLLAELKEASEKVRDYQRQFSEKESQLAAIKQNSESNPTAKLQRQAFDETRHLQNEKKDLEVRLELALNKEERLKKALAVQIEVSKQVTAMSTEAQQLREQIERNRRGQERLSKRAANLAALDAQPAWFNYVSAFTASVVSTLVMYPVDTIKTRTVVNQAAESETNGTSSATGASDTIGTDKDGPPWEDWSLEGYLSLYEGLSGALLKEGPPSAVYLGVYEAVKTSLLANPTFAPYPILVYLISGALGETLGSVVRAPAEALKTRLQTGQNSSIGESFQNVLVDEKGRENVVNAWSASLWRDVPFGAMQLAIFEGLKEYIINSPQSFLDFDVNSLAAEVVLGSIGGAIGALLTTPPDVITTRILTQTTDACEKPLGFGGMSKKVLDEGGFGALCTGWKERTGYWAPAIGIFLSCYCSLRQAGVSIFPPN